MYKPNKICMGPVSWKNYKMLMKEFKFGLNKWQNILCLQTGKLNIVKIFIFPRLIYRFIQFQSKFQQDFFFIELGRLILKFIWKSKETRIVLRTECSCTPKIHMLKPQSSVWWYLQMELWGGHESGALIMELLPLEEQARESLLPLSFFHVKNTARQPAMN